MDLAQQALQLMESFFQDFRIFKLTTVFKIIVVLGLRKWGGGGICADQHVF